MPPSAERLDIILMGVLAPRPGFLGGLEVAKLGSQSSSTSLPNFVNLVATSSS